MHWNMSTGGARIVAALGLIALGTIPLFGLSAIWPLSILAPGLVFLAMSYSGGRRTAPFAIPGMLVAGTGALLFFLDIENFQGNTVINYTELEVPFTRIVEHKFFNFRNQKTTIITKEYSADYQDTNEPYYPINNDRNNLLLEKYKNLCKSYPNVIFGGRLAEYRYYDMHHVIQRALDLAKEEGEK